MRGGITGRGTSFFNIFDFDHLMHDAIDGGLVYEGITITRNLTTASGISLWKGDRYEACWFLFKDGLFQFIDWIPCNYRENNCSEYVANPKTLVEITQSELAPFIHWNESP